MRARTPPRPIQVMELTDTSLEAQERQALLLRKLEAEKRKRLLVVPTNPAEVRDALCCACAARSLIGLLVRGRRLVPPLSNHANQMYQVVAALRALGQPVTLFGETVPDRRERLRCGVPDERTYMHPSIHPCMPGFPPSR